MISNQGKKYLELKNKTNRDKGNLGPIVQFRDTDVTVASQTDYTLSFAVPTAQKDLFKLHVDGSLLTEGSSNDFEFIEISGGSSSKIRLTSSPSVGLNLDYELSGARIAPYPSPQTVQAILNNDVAQPKGWADNGFVDTVKVSEYEIPYSSFANIGTIHNREKIKHGDLKPLLGIERVRSTSLSLLPNEFGPNGEQVFSNDDRDSRIRYIGNAWYNYVGSYGAMPTSIVADSLLEVTFYGTGLNIVLNYIPSLSICVDNGNFGSDIIPPSASNTLGNRNYNANYVVKAVSGLSLGWHTVVFKQLDAKGFEPSHIEIVNESTQLKISEGEGWRGCLKQQLATLTAIDYKPTLMGTRGGRVIGYILDGVVGQAYTPVDVTAKFLTSVDHSNEEVSRRINFREFGKNRNDDFSALTATAKDVAFTLDDGSTTLVGEDVKTNAGVYFRTQTTGDYWTITFTGTGLDIIRQDNATGSAGIKTVTIDGVIVGTITTASTEERLFKLCSGLPYGTHVLQMYNTSNLADLMVKDFIVYQPKKPVLPVGAVEVVDYNVLADYTIDANIGDNSISTGVYRKQLTRETLYKGSWSLSLELTIADAGFQPVTSTVGDYLEHTFFGTGFNYRTYGTGAGTVTAAIAVDGVSDLSSYTTSVIGGTLSFVDTTGILTVPTNTPTGVLSVNGLPLGTHTIRIALNSGSYNFYPVGLDIITPIHVNNTMVGSLSLEDKRNMSPIPKEMTGVYLGKAKAMLIYNQATNTIIDSFGIAAVISFGTGQFKVYFECPFKDANYGIIGSAERLAGTNTAVVTMAEAQRFNSNVGIDIRNASAASINSPYISIGFFGELENEGK